MKKYLFFLLVSISVCSCKEKLTNEQIRQKENKLVLDSLHYEREKLIHQYSNIKLKNRSTSFETEEIAKKIIDNCHVALDNDNENLDATKDLAFYNNEIKNHKDAVFYYSQIINIKEKQNHDASHEYSSRGIAKFQLRDYSGAAKDLEEFKKITTLEKTTIGYTEACYYLGNCYMELNERANACENFRIFAENTATDEAWEFIAKYCN
ncbi:hypothetical protein [Chryseobacterium binzhouense]|uniref:hypothetical protein n=1 Tax=Chryseobacterium binzhouense TaxID=2593646 RepID=UPI002898C22F|nr:hypothetical protein [Chryseobacterium binzhouense]